MLVGTTEMSLQDISQLNETHSTMYQLNVNDCRHYVNKITHAATGTCLCACPRHVLGLTFPCQPSKVLPSRRHVMRHVLGGIYAHQV
jgi:hypothetical protein